MASELLNDEFFLDVVRKNRNDPSIVLCHGCRLRPVVISASSAFYRTAVHFRSDRFHQEQALNLTVKVVPNVENLADNFSINSEITTYTEVLPTMAKLLKEAGINLQLVYASHKPDAIIILEDVESTGWLTCKHIISSFEDSFPAVQSLATFHAASYYINQTSIDLTPFGTTKNFGASLEKHINTFVTFCDEVASWKQHSEKFTDKFQALKPSVQEKINQVYAVNPKGFGYNVLNHGNLALPSLVSKSNRRTMLVDFHCHWGSPAIDLTDFLDKLISRELKATHRNQIIHAYFQRFVETLTKVGYLGTVPKLVELHIELLRKGFLEIFHEVDRFMSEESNTLSERGPKQNGFENLKQEQMCSVICYSLHKGLLE